MALTKVTNSMIVGASVNVLDYGAVGDGVTDDTTAIQNALNAAAGKNTTVIIPTTASNIYIIDERTSLYCLSIPSSTSLFISNGVTLKAKSGIGPVVRLISIAMASNVTISAYGAAIEGIKSEYVSGEQRHGLLIGNSTNVYVEGLTSKNTGGDGFYLGGSLLENVTLLDCTADNNRRNGVSITSGKNVLLQGCKLINQNGTDPQCGLDIEPDANADKMENITIRDCYSYNNAGIGYIIAPQQLPGVLDKILNIDVVNCVDEESTSSFSVGGIIVGSNNVSGKIAFDRCVSVNSKVGAFSVVNYDSTCVPVFFDNCAAINPTSTGSITASRYNAPFSLYNEGSATAPTTIGNVYITNPIIQYPNTAVAVVDFHARALTNTVDKFQIINPVQIGHPGNSGKLYQAELQGSNIEVYDSNELMTHSGSETLLYYNFGRWFNNIGGNATFSLPTNASYPDQTFTVEDAYDLTVVPDSGSKILPLSAVNGKYIKSTVRGSSVTLRRASSTVWIITQLVGTWTVEP
jgi:hypothetical protein